ncbi:hypothetical protein D3C72_1212150 [compost metagenome]
MHAHGRRLAAFQIQCRRLVWCQIKVLQHTHGLRHRNAAGRWGWHAADHILGAVGSTDRIALLGLVASQIGHGGDARGDGCARGHVLRHANLVHDALRHSARVERIGATSGNLGQGCCVGGVGKRLAQALGGAVCVEIQRNGIGIGLQCRLGTRQRIRHAAADLETVGGQINTGLDQVLPGLAAVVLVRKIEHAHSTWRAHRAAAGTGAGLRHGLVAVADVAQVIRRGCSGRRFTAIIGRHFLAGCIVVEHESAAANAARLWLHQPQHHLHGNRRINRRSTGFEHLAARLGRQRIGSDHHVLVAFHDLLAGTVAGGKFRKRWIAWQAGSHHHRAVVGGRLAGRADQLVVIAARTAAARQRQQHNRRQRHKAVAR